MIERTVTVVKPDGVEQCLTGKILARYEEHGLRVVGLKMLRLAQAEAEQLYAVHRERPFFTSLARYIASGPVVAIVLEGEDAVKRTRELMGATDPRQAAPGTIRRDFGTDIEHNVVHGSDSREAAEFEIAFFFNNALERATS